MNHREFIMLLGGRGSVDTPFALIGRAVGDITHAKALFCDGHHMTNALPAVRSNASDDQIVGRWTVKAAAKLELTPPAGGPVWRGFLFVAFAHFGLQSAEARLPIESNGPQKTWTAATQLGLGA